MNKPESNEISRRDLVKLVSKKTLFPMYKVRIILEAIFDTISDLLVDGKDIRILNFGSFTVKVIPSREGIDVNTGEKIILKPTACPRFVPGTILKKRCNDAIDLDSE